MCPFRHISGEKTVVCKHWLRGLCKKGDQCEFLHEYDMTKMPECYFYSKFGLLIFSELHRWAVDQHPSLICLQCISSFSVQLLVNDLTLILFVCWCSQVSVAIRNVHSCTSIQSPRLKTVLGTTEASANMVGPRTLCLCAQSAPAASSSAAKHLLYFLLSICVIILLFLTFCSCPFLRSRLQTQTHKKGYLCELPGGLLSGRKIL